jgi:very-short-patch-repair endonuclease
MHKEHAEVRLARTASAQAGVFSHAQADRAGFTRHQLRHRLRHGIWVSALPRVYRLANAPETPLQRLWAARLWAGPAAVVSHRSAGELWSFDGVVAHRAELWVPLACSKRTSCVITRRSDGMDVLDRRYVGGLRVTSPERTLLDLASVLDDETLEVAFEGARRERLVTINSVERCLQRNAARGRAGVGALRVLVRSVADRPSESALEVKVARLLRTARTPRPVQQHDVVANGRRYRLDFAWPEFRLALECDGRRRHSEDGDFQHDRTKLSDLAADGWCVLIATWRDATRDTQALLERVERATTAGAWLRVRSRDRRWTS